MTAGRPLCMPSEELVRELVNGVCAMTGISPSLVYSDDKRKAVTWSRAMVCKWLRAHEVGYSTNGIGHRLGIDHSSVLYLTKREWSASPPALSIRIKKRPKAPKAVIISLGENPKLALKTGNRIMEFISRCAVREFSLQELAAILHVSPGAAGSALKVLEKRKRLIRVRSGTYRPVTHSKPPAPITARVGGAFIRPISKERMMAGR